MYSTDSSSQKFAQHADVLQSSLVHVSSNTRSLQPFPQEIKVEPRGVALEGSVVVCEVASIGAHEKVENRSGELVTLKPGDKFIGVIGHRHSTLSMYGGIPRSGISLPREELCDLLSSGGLIGECYSAPSYLGNPTKLRLLGLATVDQQPLKIVPQVKAQSLRISCPLILIAGTSANVGKTKFASKLIHFLAHDLGRNVAATKLAGAGDFDDLLNMAKHGAKYTFDFVDAGLASTYGDSRELVVGVAKGVLNHLGEKRPDVIVAELGGDILGAHVADILTDKEILAKASDIILVPSDIFAAHGALSFLKVRGFSSHISIAQPLKNPAISQKRARSILHTRLFDCEKTEDLGRLVERIDRWRSEKENPIKHPLDSSHTLKEKPVKHVPDPTPTALHAVTAP